MGNVIGDNLSTPLANGGEHIAVGHGTQSLIPGVVAWREVLGDVVIGAQLLSYLPQQKTTQVFGSPAREAVKVNLEQHLFPSRKAEYPGRGQKFSERLRSGIFLRNVGNVGRRAL